MMRLHLSCIMMESKDSASSDKCYQRHALLRLLRTGENEGPAGILKQACQQQLHGHLA